MSLSTSIEDGRFRPRSEHGRLLHGCLHRSPKPRADGRISVEEACVLKIDTSKAQFINGINVTTRLRSK